MDIDSNTYDRARDLPELLGHNDELDDFSSAGTIQVIERLERSLAGEAARAEIDHWSYDPDRHEALIEAFEAEISRLEEKKTIEDKEDTRLAGSNVGESTNQYGFAVHKPKMGKFVGPKGPLAHIKKKLKINMKESLDEGKIDRRQNWMADFENHVINKDKKHTGKIDWNTATHMYNTGKSSYEAADQYTKNREEKK